MNFIDVLTDIRANGAFADKDYTTIAGDVDIEGLREAIRSAEIPPGNNPGFGPGDLQTAKAQPDMTLGIPKYPGNQVLRHAHPVASREGLGVVVFQGLIDAQREAFADGMRLYMPLRHMKQWVKEYFGGDFIASEAFQTLARIITYRNPYSPRIDRATLDDELSFDLSHPERVSRERKVFTRKELTHAIRQPPSVAIAVLAFQSLFLQYIIELGKVIETDNVILTPEEKYRGARFVANLKRQLATDNFLGNLLPGITVNHAVKKHPTYIEADFTAGAKLTDKNGAFVHDVVQSDGSTLHLECPFKRTLLNVSKISLDGASGGSPAGVLLAQIYQIMDVSERNGTEAVRALVKVFQVKASLALGD